MYWSSYGRGVNEVRKPDIIAPAIWLAAPMLPKTSTHNAALFFFRLAGASDRVLDKSMESNYVQTRLNKKMQNLPASEIRIAIQEYMS
jgi:serine protease AprX